MVVLSVKARRAPSQHCRNARVYGPTDDGMKYTLINPPPQEAFSTRRTSWLVLVLVDVLVPINLDVGLFQRLVLQARRQDKDIYGNMEIETQDIGKSGSKK